MWHSLWFGWSTLLILHDILQFDRSKSNTCSLCRPDICSVLVVMCRLSHCLILFESLSIFTCSFFPGSVLVHSYLLYCIVQAYRQSRLLHEERTNFFVGSNNVLLDLLCQIDDHQCTSCTIFYIQKPHQIWKILFFGVQFIYQVDQHRTGKAFHLFILMLCNEIFTAMEKTPFRVLVFFVFR